jgi:uncharacterized damage-inducible protein DinB
MPISKNLLPEFDDEMSKTRTVLERCPEAKFSFKPHPKSGTLIWLATHLANMPAWTVFTMSSDSFDYAPPGAPPPKDTPITSVKQLLATFDKCVADGRAALEGASDDSMMKPWSLLAGGKTIFTMPKVAVYRSMIMNHMIHHRAQLTVYLRLNDVPVPGLYGPSADDAA